MRPRPGDVTCSIVALLAAALRFASAEFGKPAIAEVSAKCAAVEFTYKGSKDLPIVYAFAKRPGDPAYFQWGPGLPTILLGTDPDGTKRFRALMRDLPPDQVFTVRVSDTNDATQGDNSPESETGQMSSHSHLPSAPEGLHVHRTDPRENLKKHDGSICLDVHWMHANTRLAAQPFDVYFRVRYDYEGEGFEEFCTDVIGGTEHKCGQPLLKVKARLPASYVTICGLRPTRRVTLSVEAFSCDGDSAAARVEIVTPPSVPIVVATLATEPEFQQSIAGFRPKALLDWIPQNGEVVEGHAVYLGLSLLDSMKLLCYVPASPETPFSAGHLEVPIEHKNHTYTSDVKLLRDFMQHFHVHQEQELFVATRTAGGLESPAFSFKLGSWLVLEEALKCLTSFESATPSYVMRKIQLSWTQEEGISIYD